MKVEGLKFIDLFAGIGGFHQALSRHGASCVFTSEWDKHAAKTYKKNYGIQPAGDITIIEETEIPSHDILCAGFPCQAFSVSGKQKGFQDYRGTLFFEIARIAKFHKPKLLILENVKNFERHDGGRTLAVVKNTLKELGYNISYKVLNASHYGLPQNRQRIYFVCFRNDLRMPKYQFPKPTNKPIALFELLEKAPTEVSPIIRDDIVIHKKYTPQKDISGNTLVENKPIRIGTVNKGGQGERIYDVRGHAITLSAYGGGVGSKTGLYKIGETIRKLSPRECARVQGFPDEFKIISSTTQAYKQFGNSVAINVLDEIVKEIIATKTTLLGVEA